MSTFKEVRFEALCGRLIRAGAGLAALLGAQAAWAQQPASVVAEDLEEATARVTAIDAEQRLVSLETEDGRELTVEAGEEVRNFDQIGVGDRVDVKFYEALAAEVTQAPATTDKVPVVISETRAPVGDRPAGAIGLVYTAVVTIDAVDPQTHTVNFTGPGGKPREVTVERPEMQEFVAKLKPGDRVEVTYGEAMAVAVTPAD